MAKNLLKATGMLLIINICVKLLGFGREMAIADGFGASFLTDAYLAAYTLPYLFQAVLGYAFVSAILPEMTACWQQGKPEEAHRLGSTLINITAVAMVILSLLGVLFAQPLIAVTAPGLSGQEAAMAAGHAPGLVVELTRIIFPSMLFMSVGLVISAILNSRYHFVAAAIAPGLCSLVIILSVLLPQVSNIYILAWGTLAGFILFFAVQAADLRRCGFKYRFCWDMRLPAVKRILSNIAPIVLALSVNQIYTVINRIFASGLAEGSISALNYANKLMNLPLGVFVAAIITAAFPALAEKARETDKTALVEAVKKGINMVLLIALPSAVGLVLLDGEIIRLLFERGSFTPENTAMTTAALTPMAPGLIFLAISMLLIRVYFAMGDVKTPLLAGAASVAINILLSLLLVGSMGNSGLSLANTAAAFVNAAIMFIVLGKRLPILADRQVAGVGWCCLVGCGAMAVPVVPALMLWPHISGKLGLTVQLIVLIAVAMIVYFLVLRLLHCSALTEILAEIRQRGKKNKDECVD